MARGIRVRLRRYVAPEADLQGNVLLVEKAVECANCRGFMRRVVTFGKVAYSTCDDPRARRSP